MSVPTYRQFAQLVVDTPYIDSVTSEVVIAPPPTANFLWYSNDRFIGDPVTGLPVLTYEIERLFHVFGGQLFLALFGQDYGLEAPPPVLSSGYNEISVEAQMIT